MSRRTVLTIGTFDGVHLGHRAILARARHLATQHGCEMVVLTFDPHPATMLRPKEVPPRLISGWKKIDLLKEAAADQVVVLEPTPAVLSQSAEVFMKKQVNEFQPVAIVEGEDFRFGKGRTGDVAMLRRLAKELDFQAVVLPKVDVVLSNLEVVPVSSSLVRWFIGRGRVLDAGICLGNPFELVGPVATGDQRGQTIGVPTANLDLGALLDHILPADGVYAGQVEVSGSKWYPAAISVGVKPTMGGHALTVEAHLIDFSDDLYGKTIRIQFARWLRDQQKFSSVKQLQRQLARDIARTRRWQEQGILNSVRTDHVTLTSLQ